MNEQTTRPILRPPTQAAEGLPRWRWTTEELDAMARQGVFDKDDRFELIGGEIVPMSPKGIQHEVLRNRLSAYLTRRCAPDSEVAYEPQFNLAAYTYTHPDILVYPAALQEPHVRGYTVVLVIEVADGSLPFYVGTKAKLYATHGVREYWVINARTRSKTVFTLPTTDRFGCTSEVQANEPLTASLAQSLSVRLNDLKLD